MDQLTKLCKIAFKYGTDKCPQLRHTYTPFYYQLLKKRRLKIKKVLEIGIGRYKGIKDNETIYDPGLNRNYHRGASLYMWRDFLPKAQIYGADIVPETIFQDTRISTFVCDQLKKEDLEKLIAEIGSDIDLVIDDGIHRTHSQLFTCLTLMPLLKKDVIYIIEDVNYPNIITRNLNMYDCSIPTLAERPIRDNMLIVVENEQSSRLINDKSK